MEAPAKGLDRIKGGMVMSIKLMMEVERNTRELEAQAARLQEALARIEKLEGELRAMKARMGKRETVEI